MRHLLILALLFCGCIQPDAAPPGPTPPAPVVDPTPPIPTGVMRVLILFEADDLPILPVEQMLALQGPEVRAWLTSHKADWRIWDQHIDTKFADKFWQDAVKLPRDSLPWIWVTGADGKGSKGPLPKSSAEIIDLLERHSK